VTAPLHKEAMSGSHLRVGKWAPLGYHPQSPTSWKRWGYPGLKREPSRYITQSGCLQQQKAPAVFPGERPSCRPSPTVRMCNGPKSHYWHSNRHVILITLPSPSGNRFYSCCKVGDSGPLLSALAGRR